MYFGFTAEQLEFAGAVADLLAKECSAERLREAWENETGTIDGLWQNLVEMGVPGLLAPESFGGFGLGEVDLVRIAYEAGRVALPEQLSATAGVIVPALCEHADPAVAAEVVGGILDGGTRVALGLAVNDLVVGAQGASRFLLEAADGLHLVDASDVELTAERSVDHSRRPVRVSWTPTEGTRLNDAERAAAVANDRAALFTSAELLGLADTMLALTTGYVSERKQFGVPVGSFQALKHHCANALLKIEFAKPLVWRAAYSLATGDPQASVHVSMAKASAAEATDYCGRIAMQCHGGIGYTVEYDLHLFLKRSWALVAENGSAASHRRRVADAVLGPVPA